MRAHYGVAISYPALVATDVAVHGIFAGAILLRSLITPSWTVLMLGGLTYPLYLLHQYVGYISLNALASRIGKDTAVIVVLAAMLFASFIVWRFIESPIRGRSFALMSLMSGLGSSFRLHGSRIFPADLKEAAIKAPFPDPSKPAN
jgi:peptidoglycan/LPS O-acetylase OafA/YrhL